MPRSLELVHALLGRQQSQRLATQSEDRPQSSSSRWGDRMCVFREPQAAKEKCSVMDCLEQNEYFRESKKYPILFCQTSFVNMFPSRVERLYADKDASNSFQQTLV